MNSLPQADANFQPYIGLKPFTEQEKDRFFGRDREISILLDKIRANRLTLLLAASGVGKSSLLQAGIMPVLREDSNIELIYHRDWAASPQAFKQAVSEHYGEPHKDNVSLKNILRACTLFSSGQQIILLDQFEEFFNYQRFRAEFLPFIEELSAAVLDRSLPASFVFSMREDFALELNAFKPYLPGVFDSYFRLEKLTRDQARLAIEEPLKPTGWRFEQQEGGKSLLEEVLNDLAKREQERQFGVQELLNLNELPLLVEPPHLQIVCQELWQHHRDEAAKQITQKAYEQAGRAKGILESYFLSKIQRFSKKDQALASAAFDHLIGQRATKVAHPLARLAELTRAAAHELQAVLDKLQDCAVLRRQKRGEEFWYELYHDIFSESIDKWNREFKHRQRRKRLAIGSAAVLIAGGLLFAGNNWRVNYYGRYLQLSPKESISDRIEVYKGSMTGRDIFHQRRFLHEVYFTRSEIEADKKFDRRIIEDKRSSQLDLTKKVPLASRIPLYIEAGLYGKGRDIAEAILQDNKTDNINLLPKHFAQARTKASLALLSKVLEKQSGAELKKAVVAAFAELNAVSKIVTLLKDGNSDVRSAAVKAIGQLKADTAAPEIVKLLKDSDKNVQSAAASALGQLKADMAVPEIVNLLKDSDWEVRSAAALALGQLKAHMAAQEIVKLLPDAYPPVRTAAIIALVQLKTDTAVPEIVKLLMYRSDSYVDSYVQCTAASALGHMKAYTTAPEIVKLLADNHWEVRHEAVKALGQLKAVTAAQEIVKLLPDSNWEVQRAAVKALSQLKAYTAVPEIVNLLADSDSNVRCEAVKALGQLKAYTAESEIVNLLTDSDWQVRSAAASALGQLKTESAVSEIIKLLEDSNSNVRSEAVKAIGQLKAYKTVPEIFKLLTDSESSVQNAAAEVLGRLQVESAAPEIVKLLEDSNKDVRSEAVSALGELKAESAVPEIIRLLTDSLTYDNSDEIIRFLNEEFQEDSYKDVRSAAASALGQLKAESAAPEIVRLLADSNSDDVLLQAALALARMNNFSPQLQAWQEQAFKDALKKQAVSNFDERKEAAQLLAPVFTEQAAKLLAQLMDDADQDVAQEAARAIGFAAEFYPEWMSADKLLALLQHPDLDMRETAVTSLGQLISFRGEKKAADFSELDQRVRNALSRLINDQQQKTSTRLSAIDALGNTGREECAQFLLKLLPKFDRSKEEALRSRCLFWLGRMNYEPALRDMEKELNELEQAKAEWREQRDHNSGGIADKNDAWWQEREYRLGSALARIAPTERGIKLLGHPLHYVRQGAVRALAAKADAALIGKIIQAHQDFDPADLPSPFPYTAFQAIDLALWNLEYTGKQEDVTTLQDIRAHLKPCRVPGQEGAIEERLEWTIERLKEKLAGNSDK
ncbi:HEAT repeat domain-containing protein [Candidatus Electronema sp. JM]|uniref:HEAT repeat domain-containing protein n=1 Tax=Candidatus Electronema sp. JM TaxID=3401571 RepID=UPI003AA9ABB8